MCVLLHFQKNYYQSSFDQPFFLPINISYQPCQMQRLFKKVKYTAYFGVDHQNMEPIGDQTGFQLKQQVYVSSKPTNVQY
jgi:hypothetical protein